jgi:hypothetical protein
MECVHQNPESKIIIHFDESEETAAGFPNVGVGFNGENNKAVEVGGTNYKDQSQLQLSGIQLAFILHFYHHLHHQHHPSSIIKGKMTSTFSQLMEDDLYL